MISYFLGGPVADKYPPRKLIALALWMTALGGWFFATFPSYFWLKVLYGYWGFTTIFLFWAPMIKAARVWGGNHSQGKAFGILDGGRGLTGALFGVMGVFVISILLGDQPDSASFSERREAFTHVIYYSSILIAISGLLVWLFMKSPDENDVEVSQISFHQITDVLKIPSVWLLMLIVLFAYTGYKITDDFSLYAREVMGYDEVVSARIGTLLLVIRAVVGVTVGMLADRTKTSLWLMISLFVSFAGALLFALDLASSFWILFFVSVLIVAAGVYAARALYFAVFRIGNVPIKLMGTAVGMVSVIGFAPDIFVGVLMGYFLDANPGKVGHQHVFWLLALFSFLGAICAWIFYRMSEKPNQ